MDAPLTFEPLPLRVLLDEAARETRRRLRGVYWAAAVPVAVANALFPLGQGLAMRASTSGETASAAILGAGAMLAGLLMVMVVSVLAYSALVVAATHALAGGDDGMGRAWRTVLRPRVLWTVLLGTLAPLLGCVLCIVPGIYVFLLLSLMLPVVAAEGLVGGQALGRSVALVRHNPERDLAKSPVFKVFLVLFVSWLLSTVIGLVVQLPIAVVQQVMLMRAAAGGEGVDPIAMGEKLLWMQVPANVVTALVNTVVAVYVAFGLALLYRDLSGRREGRDLEAAVAALWESRFGPAPSPEPA